MSLRLTRPRLVLAAIALLVLAAAAGWFAISRYSFDSRFARSRTELDAYAAQVIASDSSTPITPPRRIGSFEAGEALRLPHGFLFRCDFGHPLDWNGLAYSTQSLPAEMEDVQPPLENMFFEPVEGNWYKVWRN